MINIVTACFIYYWVLNVCVIAVFSLWEIRLCLCGSACACVYGTLWITRLHCMSVSELGTDTCVVLERMKVCGRLLQLSVCTPHVYLWCTAVCWCMTLTGTQCQCAVRFSEAQLSLIEDVAQRALCTFSVVDLCYSLVSMIISQCSCL